MYRTIKQTIQSQGNKEKEKKLFKYVRVLCSVMTSVGGACSQSVLQVHSKWIWRRSHHCNARFISSL